MARSVLTVMANGFEDIEAIAPIDVLTRAGAEVTISGIDSGPIQGAYGTTIIPHTTVDKAEGLFDAIVFPGGRRNAQSLARNKQVIEIIQRHDVAHKIVAAICASPSHVLAEAAGILKRRRATGDPAFNDKLAVGGAIVTGEDVTVDGHIVTGMGPGAAMLFALMLAEVLFSREVADQFAAKWRVSR